MVATLRIPRICARGSSGCCRPRGLSDQLNLNVVLNSEHAGGLSFCPSRDRNEEKGNGARVFNMAFQATIRHPYTAVQRACFQSDPVIGYYGYYLLSEWPLCKSAHRSPTNTLARSASETVISLNRNLSYISSARAKFPGAGAKLDSWSVEVAFPEIQV
jgi:hypothetical protein